MQLEINGKNYLIGKMDAKRQLHVARRIAPLLTGLGGALDKKDQGFLGIIGPISEALSKMSDEDVDYVLDACLDVCSREQDCGKFSKVTNRGNLLFSDIELPQMVQIAVAVIQENLGNFFPGAIKA